MSGIAGSKPCENPNNLSNISFYTCKSFPSRYWWLIPIILAIWKAGGWQFEASLVKSSQDFLNGKNLGIVACLLSQLWWEDFGS
jgi:hypothetical protein